MWRLRHWLAARLIRAAIGVLPESAAKDNLCRALGAWGRNTLDQLAAIKRKQGGAITPDTASGSD